MSKHTCSRRSFLRKGGIAAAGSTLFRGASEKAVDYLALLKECVQGGPFWKGFTSGLSPEWLKGYLARLPYPSLDVALEAFTRAILEKGWTFQMYLQTWGRGYMSMQFDMWLDDPTTLTTFAEYLARSPFYQ